MAHDRKGCAGTHRPVGCTPALCPPSSCPPPGVTSPAPGRMRCVGPPPPAAPRSRRSVGPLPPAAPRSCRCVGRPPPAAPRSRRCVGPFRRSPQCSRCPPLSPLLCRCPPTPIPSWTAAHTGRRHHPPLVRGCLFKTAGPAPPPVSAGSEPPAPPRSAEPVPPAASPALDWCPWPPPLRWTGASAPPPPLGRFFGPPFPPLVACPRPPGPPSAAPVSQHGRWGRSPGALRGGSQGTGNHGHAYKGDDCPLPKGFLGGIATPPPCLDAAGCKRACGGEPY